MTISQPAPQLDDYRIVTARQVLAALPSSGDLSEKATGDRNPYFWLGRISLALRELVTGWPPGAAGGLDAGQREVLAAALADAADYRETRATGTACADCDGSPDELCAEHEADFALADAYLLLAAELRIEVRS